MNIADLQIKAFLSQSTLDALLYFQTITLPRSNIGEGYYFRKLNVYNLTVCELGAEDDWCYTWDESELQKGSNKFFCTMLIYFLLKSQHIKTITHRVGI